MGIGAFVRTERLRLKLTQEAFGDRIGLSGQSVSNIERGVSNPSRPTLRKLANAFGVSLDELDTLCGEDEAAA